MEALRGTVSYLCRINRVIKEAGIDVESDLWRLMSRRAVIPELLCVRARVCVNAFWAPDAECQRTHHLAIVFFQHKQSTLCLIPQC